MPDAVKTVRFPDITRPHDGPRHQERYQHTITDWILLLALTAMWGSAFMLTKVAVAGIPSDLVAGARLMLASLLLLPIALIFGKRPSRAPRLRRFILGIAVFGYALPFSLISWGQRFIDSGLAGILMAVMPLATLGLAHFLVPGERLTPYRIVGFLLGFTGVVVLMGPSAWSALTDGHTQLLPMLAVLGGACSYAISSILARLRPAGNALYTGTTTISLATLMMLPVALSKLSTDTLSMPSAAQLGALSLLGSISTALAAILYFRLVKRASPAFVSQLNYLIPLWAVGCGILFLGEQIETRHLGALTFILSGILVTQLERQASKPRDAERLRLATRSRP